MEKMKKTIIFLNGDKADLSRVKKYIDKDTLIIGADGGTNHILKLGLKPDVVIGDLDSFNVIARERSDRSNPVKYIRYPRDKDFTDGELAIRYAKEKGYKDIIIVGLLGTRVDHLLGNIFLLLKKDFEALNIKLIEGNQEMYLVRKKATIFGKKGEILSVIPIAGEVKETASEGLKFDLKKYRLSLQGNQGISNVMTKDTAKITVKKGILLIIHTKKS